MAHDGRFMICFVCPSVSVCVCVDLGLQCVLLPKQDLRLLKNNEGKMKQKEVFKQVSNPLPPPSDHIHSC